MSAVTTATSGLYAATEQLNVAASNLANSQTTGVLSADPTLGSSALGASAASAASAGSPTGSSVAPPLAYQPLQLVQYANADVAGGGVSTSVQPTSQAAYAAYAPSSAYANANGQVAAPDIDLPSEIANQASALIQFQANLKVVQASNQLQESVINQTV
jgi:flagellar basal-body rod protein FlgC